MGRRAEAISQAIYIAAASTQSIGVVGRLVFLIDTNIWLEVLLEQEKSAKVKTFLKNCNPSQLFITDFSIYSIGIITTKLRQEKVYLDFVVDTLENSEITQISLSTSSLKKIPQTVRRFGLDFDDAYQYIAAEEFKLTIVSFDSDFDKTDRKRKSPRQLF